MNLRLFSTDDVKGRHVLVRVDFNVPLEGGVVRDATRIRESLPTIVELLRAGAYVTIISHLGRPKGKRVDELSLRPVADVLEKLLANSYDNFKGVIFIQDCIGQSVLSKVKEQRENTVILLENTRFYEGEEANDESFAKKLCEGHEVFVNDAFASLHRAHASTVGVTKFLPSYAGLLVAREVRALSLLIENPARPFAVVIGGKKISDKIPVLEGLIGKADLVLVGGAVSLTFAKAQGNFVGKSLIEEEQIAKARLLMEEFRRSTTSLILPVDYTVTDNIKDVRFLANRRVGEIGENEIGADIGDRTREEFAQHIRNSSTIFWNGPLGAFEYEPFDEGSKFIANVMVKNQNAFKVAGGGETIQLIENLSFKPYFSHISTGGGASLEFIAGKQLPGLVPLLETGETLQACDDS